MAKKQIKEAAISRNPLGSGQSFRVHRVERLLNGLLSRNPLGSGQSFRAYHYQNTLPWTDVAIPSDRVSLSEDTARKIQEKFKYVAIPSDRVSLSEIINLFN